MRKAESIKIIPVLDVGVNRWFEIGPQFEDYDLEYDRLKKRLSEDKKSIHIRLLALLHDDVLAKFPARRDQGGRFTLGFPVYREELSENARKRIAGQFINACTELALHDGFLYLETKPADDIPHLDIWLRVIKDCGFNFVATSYLLIKQLTAPVSVISNTETKIYKGDEFSDAQLKEIFINYQSKTMDRADSDSLQDETVYFDSLLDDSESEIETDKSFWRVIVKNDQPVGMIIIGAMKNELGQKDTGIILSIGVVPRYRNQGIGKILLASGLNALQSLDISEIHALIDAVNAPSMKLHIQAGFSPEPDRYMVYRKTL